MERGENEKGKYLKRTFAVFAIAAILIAALVLGACSNSNKSAGDAATQTASSQVLSSEAQENSEILLQLYQKIQSYLQIPQKPVPGKHPAEIKVTDGMGNEITLDGPAKKVIVFAPSALEIINGLDAMDRVIRS